METADLIRSLADNIAPVRPLRPPLLRAALWLCVAAALMGLLIALHGVRPRFAERMAETGFMIGVLSSLVTGILAAIAAFMTSLPDKSRLWLFLPLPPLLLWMSNIGYQCLAGWVALPPGAVTVEAASGCLLTLIVTSVPLSLLMVVMLRHVVLLRPVSAALMGSLAVAGIASSALSMFHPLDATIMVLGWNLGTAVLLVLAAAVYGRSISRRNAGRVVFSRHRQR
ncbi:NrsF family protein [Rhizobium lusitanum]|nr:NrsF family protein [Rhizobium lusitanum]